MNVHANIMVKNESLLLNKLLPIWEKYPIEKFIFYNDNSTDDTEQIIIRYLGGRAVVLNDKMTIFSESHNRSRMLEYSRENGATHVISLDADELLSKNLIDNFSRIISLYDSQSVHLFWYNVVEGTVSKTRSDPMYAENYRSFILPLETTGKFDLNLWKYHTPRVPAVNLPIAKTKDIGVVHLQAINTRFYALKQLWYKHYEFVNYNHSVSFINSRYDPVVNGLNFLSVDTPKKIVGDFEFDASIYDDICEQKGYLNFIKENYNKNLVTFGEEYI